MDPIVLTPREWAHSVLMEFRAAGHTAADLVRGGRARFIWAMSGPRVMSRIPRCIEPPSLMTLSVTFDIIEEIATDEAREDRQQDEKPFRRSRTRKHDVSASDDDAA